LLLDQEGTGVELAREAYEAGDWAAAVSEAFAKGKKAKDGKRDDMARGIGIDKREEEGRKLAGTVTEWVWEWWRD
jgi:HEPN domain-containing protein